MTPKILNLYREYLAETEQPGAAAVLALAEVVAQRDYSDATPQIGALRNRYDGLIDVAEAAEFLGYKPAGLRKLVKQGAIRYVQNGRGPIRFRREWLDDFIASNNPTESKRSPAQRRKQPTALPHRDAGVPFGFHRELHRELHRRRAA